MPSTDPFFLVRDDIQSSVRAFNTPSPQLRSCNCPLDGSQRQQARTLCQLERQYITRSLITLCKPLIYVAVQLDKAQTKYLQWQNSARPGTERRKLEAEVEDECKSIAWQVGLRHLEPAQAKVLRTRYTG